MEMLEFLASRDDKKLYGREWKKRQSPSFAGFCFKIKDLQTLFCRVIRLDVCVNWALSSVLKIRRLFSFWMRAAGHTDDDRQHLHSSASHWTTAGGRGAHFLQWTEIGWSALQAYDLGWRKDFCPPGVKEKRPRFFAYLEDIEMKSKCRNLQRIQKMFAWYR